MQSFMPTRFFVFQIQAIKNGFAGPESFRGFRETGPRRPFLEGPEKFSDPESHNKNLQP